MKFLLLPLYCWINYSISAKIYPKMEQSRFGILASYSLYMLEQSCREEAKKNKNKMAGAHRFLKRMHKNCTLGPNLRHLLEELIQIYKTAGCLTLFVPPNSVHTEVHSQRTNVTWLKSQNKTRPCKLQDAQRCVYVHMTAKRHNG